MKLLNFIFLLIFINAFSQKEYPILVKDSIRDAFIDDYKNLYVYKNSDNSILKFDSLGKRKGIVALSHSFRILSVENPLNVFLFSESGQDLKILDANLNEMQSFSFFGSFGHIKSAYIEDLQNIWLVDSSKKSLIYYNYRTEKVNQFFLLKMDVDRVVDFIVNNGKIYLLTDTNFSIYNLNSELLFSQDFANGKKLRKYGEKIFIINDHNIYSYNDEQGVNAIFGRENYKIVDKNSNQFLALIYDKFYLYKQEK